MIAYHSIFGTYGFWLPNDPRGSGSHYVAAYELFRYGTATPTDRRRSVAAKPHDRALRQVAKQALRYPPVVLTDVEIAAVVEGFSAACAEADYRIHACTVLPDHVHLVLRRRVRSIRQVIGHLKSRATRQLRLKGLRSGDRPIWGEHGWNVFLDEPSDVFRAIAYTEENPGKEGRLPQSWPVVTPFDPTSPDPRDLGKTMRRRIGGAALRSREEARRKREP